MKHTLRRLLPAFSASLLWAAAGYAEPLEQVRRFADGLESFRADFEQTVVDETGAVVELSRGEMVLAAPDRLRWHYREDYEQLIVADGRSIWSYDVDLEQVTVKPQSEAAADSPLYVLMEPATLERRYQLESHGERDGLALVELRPKDRRTDFESIELGLRDDALESLLILDAFGQQTLIRFTGIERNAPVDEALFKFQPPPGVDVIGADELELDTFASPDQ